MAIEIEAGRLRPVWGIREDTPTSPALALPLIATVVIIYTLLNAVERWVH